MAGGLTLLLKSSHDLYVCHVLQFVAHGDGVFLQLRGPQLAVQGRLGTDGSLPASDVYKSRNQHKILITFHTTKQKGTSKQIGAS